MNNFSQSVALPHEHFVAVLLGKECEDVIEAPLGQRCAMVKKFEDCHDEERVLDYMSFIFCFFGEKYYWTEALAQFILALWISYLFFLMGLVADKFFSGGLAGLSRFLDFSENLAGVTLLAFGNGAPDIFGALADPDRDSVIFVTEQLGCAVFMTSIIAGSIAIIRPFQANGANFVRDGIFLIITAWLVSFSISDAYYQLEESICTFMLYFIYLSVVIVMHWRSKSEAEAKKTHAMAQLDVLANVTSAVMNFSNLRAELVARIEQVKTRLENQSNDEEQVPVGSFNFLIEFKKLFDYVNGWRDFPWYWKAFYVFHVPSYAIILFIIPNYDFTISHHGWNKPLNILNLFILPQICCIIFLIESDYISTISIPLMTLWVSTACALLVFFTSSCNKAPRYHWIFGVLNFVGSVVLIFAFSSEIVCILTVFTTISQISQSIMGVTVMAFGKGIGDAVANISLAKSGYQRMAFAACFGGAIFNILIVISLTFISKALRLPDHTPPARMGVLGPNCVHQIYCITFLLLFAFGSTGFQARKSIGYFLIATYCFFLFNCILSEVHVIHPAGTDHHNEEADYE